MKNYKILENRPELKKEQLTEGMDFSKIKADAAVAKTAALKTVIIKIMIGATMLTSGIFIYNRINQISPKNDIAKTTDTTKVIMSEDTRQIVKVVIPIHTVAPMKKIKYNDTITLTSSKANIVDTPNTASVSKIKALSSAISHTIKEMPVIDTVFESIKQSSCIISQITSKNSSGKSCVIWHSNDYCSIARTKNFKYTIECDACEFDDVNCANVNQNNNVVCVLLTLYGDRKQNFKIETGFKNIMLINANNNKVQPLMVGIGNDTKFIGTNFKAKKFLINFDKEIQLLLFFKNAKVGDKVIINNFIEAQIEK